jgi:hypothetical protein
MSVYSPLEKHQVQQYSQLIVFDVRIDKFVASYLKISKLVISRDLGRTYLHIVPGGGCTVSRRQCTSKALTVYRMCKWASRSHSSRDAELSVIIVSPLFLVPSSASAKVDSIFPSASTLPADEVKGNGHAALNTFLLNICTINRQETRSNRRSRLSGWSVAE